MPAVSSAHAVFSGTIQKSDEWLHELMNDLKWDDPNRAYAALRATLQTLRDCLTTQEIAQLSAQLPLLLRGVWFEGWVPRDKPLRIRKVEDFLDAVNTMMPRNADVSTYAAVTAVFRLLKHRVSDGEIADVKATLPTALRSLWPE